VLARLQHLLDLLEVVRVDIAYREEVEAVRHGLVAAHVSAPDARAHHGHAQSVGCLGHTLTVWGGTAV
jgi:hypothetical protein